MDIRKDPLFPEKYYHIYNRGLNSSKVFFEDKNYGYFLELYLKFVHPFVETHAYCLLANHFHFLIKVRSKEALDKVISKNKDNPYYWHIGNAFASLFQAYTRGINKSLDRTGSIFERPFKRKEVAKESYFTALVAYIHTNPEKHRLVKDFREYPHSSYLAYLSEKKTNLCREEVINWFGGKKSFVKFHQDLKPQQVNDDWLLE